MPRWRKTLQLAIAGLVGLGGGRAAAHLIDQRDLEALLRASSVVIRGEVAAVDWPPVDDEPPRYRLKVIRALKGQLAGEVTVIAEGHHPVRFSQGERGLFFLAPSKDLPGKLGCIQGGGERWALMPASEEGADRLVEALVAGPADRLAPYVEALRVPAPRIAAFAVARLATAAMERKLGESERAALLELLADESVPGPNRAAVAAALGHLLSSEKLLSVASAASNPDAKAALLAAASVAARGEEIERARSVLGAARSDPDPGVALAAAAGLARLGDEGALSVLRDVLAGGSADNRAAATLALEVLARKGSGSARAELKALRADRDPVVRARAERMYLDLLRAGAGMRERGRYGLMIAGVAFALLVLGASLFLWGGSRA